MLVAVRPSHQNNYINIYNDRNKSTLNRKFEAKNLKIVSGINFIKHFT